MSNANGIIESLIKENEGLRQENRQLREIVETLNRKLITLEEKLAASKKNSRNSSKPPSSDIVKPKKPKTSENEGKRKAGGQPGHPKHTRPLYTKDASVHVTSIKFHKNFNFVKIGNCAFVDNMIHKGCE